MSFHSQLKYSHNQHVVFFQNNDARGSKKVCVLRVHQSTIGLITNYGLAPRNSSKNLFLCGGTRYVYCMHAVRKLYIF